MLLFQAMDTSASGLTAQRLRLDVIANNLANANTTRTAEGGPYRREVPVLTARHPSSFNAFFLGALAGGEIPGGVMVASIEKDPRPPKMVYDPGHPDADARGYVAMPNVEVVSEMVDLIAATRAYEANISSINAFKAMAAKALEIGRG